MTAQANEPQAGETFVERLNAAIEEAGINNSALARRLADISGNTVQSERRAVGRYRKGETQQPEPPKARQLAQALNKPADYFISERSPTISEGQRIAQMLERLSAELLEPGEHQTVIDRLAALERQVAALKRAVSRGFHAVEQLLSPEDEQRKPLPAQVRRPRGRSAS